MTPFSYRLPPALTMLAFALFSLGLSAIALVIALAQPHLDLPRGAVPVSLSGVPVLDSDLVEEPDQLGSYDAIKAFRARQGILRAELDAAQLLVEYALPDGTRSRERLAVRDRTLADLPGAFWFQNLVGLVSALIGGWVLGLRPRDWGARMFALTALFTPVFAVPASVYSTRQIALYPDLFYTLSVTNGTGALLFGIALVGLFTQYPKPLFRAIWILVPAAIFGTVIVLNILQTGPDNAVAMGTLAEMVTALLLGIVQWVRSRREPVNRAGLRWFILVSLTGCSLFIFLVVAPPALGLSQTGIISQGVAFAFFNVMHVGLALGVLRYKVFNLDRWSYYIWLWLSGMLMLLALDIAILRILQTQPWISLATALFFTGFLYFPIRQVLLHRLLRRRSSTLAGKMPEIIGVALSPTQAEHSRRWDRLLGDIFDPLAPPEALSREIDAARIEDDGLSLLIPGVDEQAPRRLRYAMRGRRLFTPEDLEVAANLVQTHELAAESRRAYERGVILERDRISRDIHDNIGAQLLSALHSRELARKDDLLRDSLADLRTIINDGFQAQYDIAAILADLRTETAARIDVENLVLRWHDQTDFDPEENGLLVPFEVINGLRSILREAVSNVLRHARASTVEVTIGRTPKTITLEVLDDGIGTAAAARSGRVAAIDGGNGIPNIVERAAALAGRGRVAPRGDGETGTRITVELPLDPDAVRAMAAAE